jgi:hypothetical protein
LKLEAPLTLRASAEGGLVVTTEQIENVDYFLVRSRVHERLFKKRKGVACRLTVGGCKRGQQLTFISQIAWDEGEYPEVSGYHADVAALDELPW